MSETMKKDGINININNSDSNSGGNRSFLDKIFDLGLKVVLPLALLLVVGATIIVVRLLIPLLELGGDFIEGVGTFFPSTGGTLIGIFTAGVLGILTKGGGGR
jgi:hypothetical protein